MPCFCRRHLERTRFQRNPLDDATCERVAWDDGCEAACSGLESIRRIETQACFTRSIIRAVARKAFGRQDWKHIRAVADTLSE